MTIQDKLINSEEARKIHGISKPRFKKWLDIAKPERVRVKGIKGYLYQPEEMQMLEVLYLRALADIKESEIKAKYFLP